MYIYECKYVSKAHAFHSNNRYYLQFTPEHRIGTVCYDRVTAVKVHAERFEMYTFFISEDECVIWCDTRMDKAKLNNLHISLTQNAIISLFKVATKY
jgi:hypothetical protein